MQTREMRDGRLLYFTPQGAWLSSFLEKGVILALCRGVLVAEFAPQLIRDGERAIAAHGRCFYMVDALASDRMDASFRELLTSWLSAARERASMHVLLQSTFLELAVHVAALSTGPGVVLAYRDRSAWEDVVRAELPGFKRGPWASSCELRAMLGDGRMN